MKPDLTLVFRDQRAANHSIEKLFSILAPYFKEHFNVTTVTLPMQPSGFRALYTNILHARREARGIIHITGDAQYLVPFFPRGKTVLTVHDCSYLLRLKGLKKLVYKWIWFVIPFRFARLITAVSQSTRTLLEENIGHARENIVVIENCLTITPENRSKPFNSKCPLILQIGTGSHKNLEGLIKAVEGISCEILVVGRLSEDNRNELEKRGIAYRNEFAVTDKRLREIYAECDMLFFASKFEGFGLPILEAQAAKIPCITSNISSMPHVAGEGAFLVDPFSSGEIREAIKQICESQELRHKLVENGSRNLRRFEPSVIAAKYMNVYRECLQSN